MAVRELKAMKSSFKNQHLFITKLGHAFVLEEAVFSKNIQAFLKKLR